MEAVLLTIVQTINSYLSNYVLIILLVAMGVFFTIRTRGVQFRCFGEGMRRVFGADPEGKLRLLLSFAGKDRDVADPWYTDDFEAAYRDIDEGCRALLAFLLR